MMSVTITFLLITLSISPNDAAKILAYFPFPSISHQVVFRPLTQELARRGHVVTVITTDPAFQNGDTPANLTEIDVHDFSYKKWSEWYKVTSGEEDKVKKVRTAFFLLLAVVEMQLKEDKVQKLFNEKFDLLLIEACGTSQLLLSHIFKVPVIQVSSFGAMNEYVKAMGLAWHPLLYPDNFTYHSYNLTKWEKIQELWNFYRIQSAMQEIENAGNEMAKKLFGPNVPSINELHNNVDMLFLNVHPIWESNRPVPPSVIYMGGLHQKPVKELPKDLKTYLDSSKNGVVYVSFGTNVRTTLLPPERVQFMVKVFSELPYDVLWKYDKDELPGRSKNIKISKWLPQSDLLRHPKIKVFITQGGLQSTDEAITAGVPLIGIPMMTDQFFNSEKYVFHKIGAQLHLHTMTEEEFKNTIYDVINDKSFRHNVVKLRQLMRDQPQSPLERAVWWTEHVLRHGGARHLRAPAANMPWTEYLEMELVLIVLTIVLSIVLVFSFLAYKLWKSFNLRLVAYRKKKEN